MIAPAAVMATIRFNLVRRPLMHPATAQECLDVGRVKLTQLVESGALPWAWNFSAGGTRLEMRILAHCIVEKVMGILPAIGATKNLKLKEVIALVLPQRRESLRGAELQRLFHVSADNIRDLHGAGEIFRVVEKLPAQGINASPRYTTTSLAKLLARRRMS